mgnify:CR=1 FL=1
MTTTILRHELIRTKRPLLVILGIAVVLIALADLLGLFVGVIGLVFAIMLTFTVVPAVQLFFAIDFYRSSYGSGALLTHSLPVRGRKLFWTKMLFAFLVTVLVSILTLIVLLLQGQLVLSMGGGLAEAYRELQLALRQLSALWLFLLVSAAWMVVIPLASMFSSVVIGSGGWARRLSIGGPIIVFMGYYVLMQILGFVSFFIPPVVDIATGEVHGVSMFQSAMSSPDAPLLPLSIVFIHILIIAGLLIWASRDMDKKVELR